MRTLGKSTNGRVKDEAQGLQHLGNSEGKGTHGKGKEVGGEGKGLGCERRRDFTRWLKRNNKATGQQRERGDIHNLLDFAYAQRPLAQFLLQRLCVIYRPPRPRYAYNAFLAHNMHNEPQSNKRKEKSKTFVVFPPFHSINVPRRLKEKIYHLRPS